MCDKLTYNVLVQYGCQTSKQVKTCMNRMYDDSYSTGSIGASLPASSENERGQKVYWITDFGKECAKDYALS
jgi:hypothetical protein